MSHCLSIYGELPVTDHVSNRLLLSARPSVSTPTFEPSDLDLDLLHVYGSRVITIALVGLKVRGQGMGQGLGRWDLDRQSGGSFLVSWPVDAGGELQG